MLLFYGMCFILIYKDIDPNNEDKSNASYLYNLSVKHMK